MCKNISYDDVVEASSKIMSDMPIQLLRKGKNIIGRIEEVLKEHCFMIRLDLKAFLIKGCQKIKRMRY